MERQRTYEVIGKDVKKAQGGDMEAMERILGDVQDMVHYTCLRMLKNEDRAQDAAQEILIQVYQKLGSLSDPLSYIGWVKRITANHCKNLLSRANREFLLEEQEEGEDPFAAFEDLDEQKVPDKALDSAESRRLVNEIVDGLPDEQRLCVVLYYYDEMKTREIAGALNVSEGTVKSRLNYARRSIKAGVDKLSKEGVTLYGGMPLPFLGYILREASASAVMPALVGEVMAASATAATVATAATAATATTGTGLGAFFATVTGKVVAAVVTVAVLGGVGTGIAQAASQRQAEGAMGAATPEATAYVTQAPATPRPTALPTEAPTAAMEPTPTPSPSPTATSEPPENTYLRLTGLEDADAERTWDDFLTLLREPEKNLLGRSFTSPVVKVWEIHSLEAYLSYARTHETIPEGELPCYGVLLLDGTELYLYLGQTRIKGEWDVYRVKIPATGQYLLKKTYLDHIPVWSSWSTEEPPEDALQVESKNQRRVHSYDTTGVTYGKSATEPQEAYGLAYLESYFASHPEYEYYTNVSKVLHDWDPWFLYDTVETDELEAAKSRTAYLDGNWVQFQYKETDEGKIEIWQRNRYYSVTANFWRPWTQWYNLDENYDGVSCTGYTDEYRTVYRYLK